MLAKSRSRVIILVIVILLILAIVALYFFFSSPKVHLSPESDFNSCVTKYICDENNKCFNSIECCNLETKECININKTSG